MDGKSNCTGRRFQNLAREMFGHLAHKHQLLTPRQKMLRSTSLRPGDRVTFEHDGHEFEGFVNRINKNATVLVEAPLGRPYSDGRSYEKYYVPLGRLRLQAVIHVGSE